MIIKLAGLWDSGLKLLGRTFAKGASKETAQTALGAVLRNPVVKNTLIGTGVGAVSGFATGDPKHKMRSTLVGAGLGAAGGLGSAAIGVTKPFEAMKTDWSKLTKNFVPVVPS